MEPVCLPGDRTSTELCRLENHGLYDVIKLLKDIQARHEFSDLPGLLSGLSRRRVTFADVLTIAAGAAVERCSNDEVKIDYFVGKWVAMLLDRCPLALRTVQQSWLAAHMLVLLLVFYLPAA